MGYSCIFEERHALMRGDAAPPGEEAGRVTRHHTDPVRRCPTDTKRSMMDFYGVLDQVLALLRQRGRVSYRALKRQFDLDDAFLDDLKVEIIEVQQCARDQEGTMLVWTGQDASAVAPAPIQPQALLAYTPPYLAEKILTSRSALEGERKQVTVLFADLKGSMEL